MSLFGKKKKNVLRPSAFYVYVHSDHYRGFKRYRLSTYGHVPAMNGLRALSGKSLTGASVKLSVYEDEHPRIVVSVGKYEVGTLWAHSFDRFNDVKNGLIEKVHLELYDDGAYVFLK